MLDVARRHRLLELFVVAPVVVAPVLQQIASDDNMEQVARRRARAILGYAQAGGE
jgi:hypothetical protein